MFTCKDGYRWVIEVWIPKLKLSFSILTELIRAKNSPKYYALTQNNINTAVEIKSISRSFMFLHNRAWGHELSEGFKHKRTSIYLVIWFRVCKFYEMPRCNNGGCRNVARSQQRANMNLQEKKKRKTLAKLQKYLHSGIPLTFILLLTIGLKAESISSNLKRFVVSV